MRSGCHQDTTAAQRPPSHRATAAAGGTSKRPRRGRPSQTPQRWRGVAPSLNLHKSIQSSRASPLVGWEGRMGPDRRTRLSPPPPSTATHCKTTLCQRAQHDGSRATNVLQKLVIKFNQTSENHPAATSPTGYTNKRMVRKQVVKKLL